MNAATESDLSVTTPDDVTIRIERTFDAPRELVWEAWTDPELLAEWLGPHGSAMTIEEMYLREGGSYRWGTENSEIGFFGEYREIKEPEVLESTFSFQPDKSQPSPYPPSIDRLELIDLGDGRTKTVTTSTYESKELRDGMIQSGMETGVRDGYEKLDAQLARRQA